MSEDLAILVLSCDKYSTLWNLFFNRWEKYWPNCNYPIYLLSNTKDYERSRVKVLKTGVDIDWSSNLKMALSMIKEDKVLLMMDDAPLNREVNTEDFERLVKYFNDKKANYLNMKASPKPQSNSDDKAGDILPGAIYRTAIVPCLWNKNILIKLLKNGETAWDFEIIGSERSKHIPGFKSTRKPFFNLLHCIIRGKLDRRAWKVLKRCNELNHIDFPVMTKFGQIKLVTLETRSKIFNIVIPNKYKKYIRGIFNKNE